MSRAAKGRRPPAAAVERHRHLSEPTTQSVVGRPARPRVQRSAGRRVVGRRPPGITVGATCCSYARRGRSPRRRAAVSGAKRTQLFWFLASSIRNNLASRPSNWYSSLVSGVPRGCRALVSMHLLLGSILAARCPNTCDRGWFLLESDVPHSPEICEFHLRRSRTTAGSSPALVGGALARQEVRRFRGPAVLLPVGARRKPELVERRKCR